ncbi:hypothetical protein Vretifemale_12180 [Volvox reticuliferus]|uniref:Uncharacterized protein n=1 Tax=Volvox reticuliferus TaxID=1737510 RepID=A0A8J4CIW1_9CHLO|nr:hypothetical protein Vretifemale_12180 [Volvox reticuliferus]
MDNITVFVDGFRVVQGGWLRLSLKSVASDGAVVRVELGRAMNTAAGNITMETAVGAGNASMATFPPEQLRAADPSSSAAEQGTDSTTNWKLMTNTYGAEWEVSGLPSPPYDLRLTDRFNRQIILPSAVTKAGALGEFPGRAQFPGLDNVTISEKAAANIKASAAMASINTLTSSEAPTLRVAPVLQIDNPAATPTKVVTHKSAPPAQGAPILKPSIVKTVSGPTRHRLLNTANPTANSITRGSTPRRRLRQGTRGQKTGPMP